jgi:hypothetical protein
MITATLIRFLRTSHGAHVGLGVIASVYLPTIDPKNRFLGETQLVPQVVGVLDKELGREQRLRISLNGCLRPWPWRPVCRQQASGVRTSRR